MKTLIVYLSVHHGNTEKIAATMANVLAADLKQLHDTNEDDIDKHDTNEYDINKYDMIGFGSGIYFFKHHKAMLSFIDNLVTSNKKAFIFSTRGGFPMWVGHRTLKKALKMKKFNIVGEFSCKGWDTYGILKYIGGKNKGKPNKKDIQRARGFAKGLLENKEQHQELNSVML